jgi:pimeloyl-ACP methyl ester carboxylesterase
MRATELFSGDGEPAALKDIVKRIDVPVLLVASNAAHEREIDAHYRDEIADAELWYVDDAGHTDARDVHPARYAGRVNAFLANALRASGPQ